MNYLLNTLINLLEDKLPADLFLEVKKYLDFKEIDETKNQSQTQLVLNHLMVHGDITNMQCHLLYGIRHCPSVIRDIKKQLALDGKYKIDYTEKNGCNRYGKKVKWKTYIIKEVNQNAR